MIKKIMPGIFFAVVLVGIFLVANNRKSTIAVVLLDSNAHDFPHFSLPLVISGKEQAVKLGKHGTVIHFWASWCAPCVAELPELISYAAKSEQTFYIIAVSDKLKRVKKFLAKFKNIPSNVIFMINEQGSVSRKMGTFKLPESYIYDVSGKLVSKIAGSKKWL